MPEGPEVHRQADRLNRVLENRVAEQVFFAFPKLEARAEELRGQRVARVSARGKALLTQFSSGAVVYTHNQLYGRWYVRRRGTEPRTGRSLRFAIHTATHSALLYSASEIEVLEPELLDEHPYLSKLGPDVLDGSTTAKLLRARFESDRFRRRRFGSLLLDQSFAAGMGNYLRSEALFRAGLAPELRPDDVERASLAQLSRAIISLARRSYETGGVTLDERRARAAARAGGSRNDRRFFAFGRAGKPCVTCGASIVREESAGRRLYRCPRCQG